VGNREAGGRCTGRKRLSVVVKTMTIEDQSSGLDKKVQKGGAEASRRKEEIAECLGNKERQGNVPSTTRKQV